MYFFIGIVSKNRIDLIEILHVDFIDNHLLVVLCIQHKNW